MKKFIVFVGLFLIMLPAMAAPYFSWSPNMKQAYNLVTQLRIKQSLQLIETIKREEPENLMVYFVEDYTDFFNLFISEDPKTYANLKDKKDLRLKLIRKGPIRSPYYRFCQADITLHWALIKLKFNEKTGAAIDIRKAFHLLEENKSIHPDFAPNQKSLGVLHALIGTIPDSYKWMVRLIGISGTIDQGTRELELAMKSAKGDESIFEVETIVMFSFLMLYLQNSPEKAWKIVNSGKLNPLDNPLAAFALANIASRSGKNDVAIEILENRPSGAEYFPFHYLDLLEGMVRLKKLDLSAEPKIHKFISKFKGKNYVKEAYQKLAWIAVLKGDKASYFDHIRKCKTLGSAETDEDKSAAFEAETNKIPHVELLQARLLSDGGYSYQSYKVLINASKTVFDDKEYQLEYNYRLGRAYQMLKNYPDAIENYNKVIEMGENEPFYYACKASLYIGNIYEEQKQRIKSIFYYKKTLDMNPLEYSDGLHQKAKAGLNRLQ